MALEDTDRIHGRSAFVNNVKAAVALSGAVRSTLGPKGLDKMLVDEDGDSTVTNDGVTVLETAKVEHPTARLLVSTSSSQDRAARDGTTTAVILTSELLQNSLELVRAGVHPSVILNGYQIALSEAQNELERISMGEISNEHMRSAVATSLSGKVDSAVGERLTGLALEALDVISTDEGGDDLERLRVKRLRVKDGGALDSEIVSGLVLAKSRMDVASPSSYGAGRIVIIDGGMESPSLELEASIEVTDIGALQEFRDRAQSRMREQVEKLASMNVDLLVVRDGIDETASTMLTDAGITAYRRFEREDLEMLSRITGASMVRDSTRVEATDVGAYASRSEKSYSSIKHTRIDGSEGGAVTIIIRGSSPSVLSLIHI